MSDASETARYKAELGEGLIGTSQGPAWVDIVGQKVIWGERIYSLDAHIPSVIFEAQQTNLLIGTHRGICRLFRDGQIERVIILDGLDSERFRLNDGCKLSDGSLLVGSMSRDRPEQEAGRIYRIFENGRIVQYDWPCHIPNSFIELDDGQVLITDSLHQRVYRVAVGDSQISATIWYQADGICTPDGGCRLPNGHIALAMWDGACLRVFDEQAGLVGEIALSVVRPTNCLYDKSLSGFFVTSAKQGLDSDALITYPESGQCLFKPWSIGE
jgi:sugar lactone lactonase YvrE